MGRIYSLHECSVEYQETIIEKSLDYGIAPYQGDYLSNYLGGDGSLQEGLEEMKRANDVEEFKEAFKEANSEIRNSNSLYFIVALNHVRQGPGAREEVRSDLSEAKDEYSACRFCAIYPTDSACLPDYASLTEEPEEEPEDEEQEEDTADEEDEEGEDDENEGTEQEEEESEEEQDESESEGTCDIIAGSETAKLEITIISVSDFAWDEDSPDEKGVYHTGEDQVAMLEAFDIKNTKTGKCYLGVQALYAVPDGEEFNEVNYSVLLDADDEEGLPLCAGYEAAPWSSCDGLDKLTNHHIHITFKGEEYVLSSIESVSGGVPHDVSYGESYEVSGAEITLSEEETWNLVGLNETLSAEGSYSVRMDGVSEEVGPGNGHAAIVSLLDSGDEVCQEEVYPGETAELCGEGVLLHAYQVAPGQIPEAIWAELGIYSEEMVLESGSSGITLFFTSEEGASEGDDPGYLREIVSADSISYWEENGLSDDSGTVEETSVFTLYEGESVGFPDGVEIEVQSIDQVLSPSCEVVAESESVELLVQDIAGEEYEYVLFEGEETMAEGVIFKVLEIEEETTTQ
ncbi:hypothetical protein GF415_03480 [Candidatus Micrarchaeota archaeon]|nr:hypothetical protein [Candidatus Micrarchaeota archaeon]